MFINDKKILGTEASIPAGNLGLFAGSDDNFYVKKSDGSYYTLTGANSNTNAQIIGTISLISGSSSVISNSNVGTSSVIFITKQDDYAGIPSSLSLHIKKGLGTFSIHSLYTSDNGVIGYMIFNI